MEEKAKNARENAKKLAENVGSAKKIADIEEKKQKELEGELVDFHQDEKWKLHQVSEVTPDIEN
jgi:DNA-directed RNA polymerase subunit F